MSAEWSSKERLKLVLAYDGQPWRGWQMLPGGETVQDRLNEALAKISSGPVRTQGSGRTDAGVHALGQVAHAEVEDPHRLPPGAWRKALNACLPASIRVLEASVAKGFHARYDAIGKRYRYRIWRGEVLNPLEVNRAWHVYGALDLELLRRMATLLEGTHDFSRLSANRGGSTELPETPDPDFAVRRIDQVEIREESGGQVLNLEFEGQGFLYKMVRMLVGSMIHVARGRGSFDWFADLLAQPKQGSKSHHTAPAGGLCLMRVHYPDSAGDGAS